MPWDGETAGELEVRGPWITAAYYGGAEGEPFFYLARLVTFALILGAIVYKNRPGSR